MTDAFDVVVIGGGPGGYNAAIRAGQLGLTSACIDKRGSFGGTCLNIGCIPSKALLYTSELFELAAKDFAKLGIKTSVALDLPAMMAHKTKVVGELTHGGEIAKQFQRILQRQGMRFLLSSKVTGVERTNGVSRVQVESAKGEKQTLDADIVLVAIGRQSFTDGLALDELGAKRDERGRVIT